MGYDRRLKSKIMKKILFITGTRADYGKIKSLLKEVEADPKFELHIFVSGMHLVDKLGSTYREVLKDKYENIYVDFSQANTGIMSFDLGNVISNLTNYCRKIKPDMIVSSWRSPICPCAYSTVAFGKSRCKLAATSSILLTRLYT